MEKIASFTINHLVLEPGVYVSRVDTDPDSGGITTTFDIRIARPNREPVMDTSVCHCLEHLCATYMRSDPEWASRIVYFGPMGCRTGCYLVVFGKHEPSEIVGLITRTFEFVRDFEGEVPGAKPAECGNWHDSDLNASQWWARRYLETLYAIDEAHMTYPPLDPVAVE